MDPSELLNRLSQTLEELHIPYLVTGSMATIAYGEPRFTNDIDVVIRMAGAQVAKFCTSFPDDEFYISPEAVMDAVSRNTQFNILHPSTGLKVDVMVADQSDFNDSRFSRARRLQVAQDRKVTFASPEDVIIKKLAFFQEGGSEKHVSDIRGVLTVMGEQLDRAYIEIWVARLGLMREWSIVLKR
jgi:hypothetical protein